MSSQPLGAYMRSRDNSDETVAKLPRISVAPSVGRAIGELVATKETPYRVLGDFHRDAVGRLLDDCNTFDPMASPFYQMARLEMLLDAAAAHKLAVERIHGNLSVLQFNLENPFMDDILATVRGLGGKIEVPWSLDVK